MTRRYLTKFEAEAALRRVKSVEAFLGRFEHAEGNAVRYVVVSSRNGQFWLELYEGLEPGYETADIYAFGEADPRCGQGEPTWSAAFPSFDYALEELEMIQAGASGKLVNEGVAADEYVDAKNSGR